jgi:NTE family protein
VRPLLNGMGSSDFSARRRAIEAGRVAMRQLMPQLRAAMEAKSR